MQFCFCQSFSLNELCQLRAITNLHDVGERVDRNSSFDVLCHRGVSCVTDDVLWGIFDQKRIVPSVMSAAISPIAFNYCMQLVVV